MTWVVMAISIGLAGMLQLLLPGPLWLGQAKWPLLLGVVVYYALQHDAEVLWPAALLAGFLQDALSPSPLGVSSGCFLLAGWAIARLRPLLLVDSVVTQAFFGGVAAFGVGLLWQLWLRDGRDGLSAWNALHRLAGLGVEGALSAPLMFWMTGGLDRMVGNVHPAKEVEGPDGDLDGFAE